MEQHTKATYRHSAKYMFTDYYHFSVDLPLFKKPCIFDRFISLLEKNYKSKKMVSDYAKELFLSPNYLNELIKRASGYPASYHISQRVVKEAKYKALYSGSSMKQIAYELGFDDVAHFSKYFKNVCGKNFTDFRKEYLANYS